MRPTTQATSFAFGDGCGLSRAQLEDTAKETINAAVWSEREFVLLKLTDELHERATLSDEMWEQLAAGWSNAQILEVIIIVGWYHLISFVANAAQVEQESWAARFPNTSEELF